MAYVSLYRKYRPQTFSDIVGQDHVTRSLINALTDDRLHHAYLFTGPRGTGKTSTARILAKSVNCVEGPTPTPCNLCQQCVSITEGSSVDVIELDMASHGGVEDARELRDRARFSPASARRKVYILDEVHMASNAAFNALLKLIEEPPSHVLFAMATTDPQKVLPTIMSRVQRLDLRRVGATDVAGRVTDLVTREGATIDKAAIDAVVRAGDGSLRDTESVLEQVLSYSEGGNVTGDDVEAVLGQTPFESTAAVVDAMVTGNLAVGFDTVQQLLDRGTDLRVFTTDLVRHVRDLLVLVVAPDRQDLVDATDERRAALVVQSRGLSASELTRALQALGEALDAMRKGEGARLAVELAIATVVAQGPGVVAAPAPAEPWTASSPASDGASPASDAIPDTSVSATVEDTPDDSGTEGDADPAADDAGESFGQDPPAEDQTSTTAAGAADVADKASPSLSLDDVDTSLDPVGDEEDADGGEDVDDVADDVDDVADDVAEDSQPEMNDLAARAKARGAEVARDGMPTPVTERPDGPAVERDLPPEPDEVAQLDVVQSRWSAVLELVRADSVRAEAMLAKARPTRLRRRILVLSYPSTHKFHAEKVANQEFDEFLIPAIERTCDVTVRIDVEVDGEPTGGGNPKPDEPVTASTSPADRAAARAGGAVSGTTDHLKGTTSAPGSSQGTDATGADAAGSSTGPVERNPMADLDPAEAMDRAAAALMEQLGAVEVDPTDR